MRNPFKRRREDTLVRITQAMLAEDEIVVNNLCYQVEEKLLAMSPGEREKVIKILRGERAQV